MQKRDFLKTLALGGLAAGAGVIGAKMDAGPDSAPQARDHQDAFAQILKRGTLRCGYIVYAPNFVRDPNTGKFSGIFYDLMEQAGKNLNLKIEWVEEAGLDQLTAGLESGRLDVIASGLWSNSARARVTDFSKPVFFNALGVYVRKGEKRFKSLADLNQRGVRLAVIDAGMADQLGTSDFPNARKVSIPAISDYPFLLKMVSTGKADFTIAATHEFSAHDKNNPGELERLDVSLPIRVFPNVLFVAKGCEKLRLMLDTALDELYFSGVTNRVVDQYEEHTGSFYRVQAPYAGSAQV